MYSTNGPESWAGLAYVGARGMWLRSSSPSVFVHECGHNLGLGHSNYLDTGNARSIGGFFEVDYGNPSDWMGSGQSDPAHFVTAHKDRLTVLPFPNILVPYKNGVYRVYAHDTGVLNDPSRPQAIRLGLSKFLESNIEHSYYVEFRNQSTLKGVQINLYASAGYEVRLVNAQPYNPSAATRNAREAFLPAGSTFYDDASEILITHRGAVFTGQYPYVDLEINFGYATNAKPTGSVTGTYNITATGKSGNYTVSASDADGDALSYTWYVDTKLIVADASATTITTSFATAGNHTVRCHIFDGKGGLFVATYGVIVGRNDQAKPVAYGTVRDSSNGQVIPWAHVFGNPGGSYRGGVTNNAGIYSISELPTATAITLSAQAGRYDACTAQFTNGATLNTGDVVSGWDFSCDPLPTVSIAASGGPLTNGSVGTFTVTRSGSTAGPLFVSMYCFSEGYSVALVDNVGLPRTWNMSIAAGSASSTISLRHARTSTTDTRHFTAWCTIVEGYKYQQTPASRAALRLAGTPGPANDDFANARVISGLNLIATGSFNNASTEPNEPSSKQNYFQVCPSVWFKWSAPASGFLTIGINATASSTVHVYAGSDIASLASVTPRWGRTTPLQLAVDQGTEYMIQLWSCSQQTWYPGRPSPRASDYSMTLDVGNAVFLPPTASNSPRTPGSGNGSPSSGSGGVVSSAFRSAPSLSLLFGSFVASLALALLAL